VPSIGLDFDGVIFDMGPVIEHVALSCYGIETPDDGIPAYNLEELYNLTPKQAMELVLTCQENRFLESHRFVQGAIDALEKLASQGYPLIVITARPKVGPVAEYLQAHLDVDQRLIKVLFSRSKNKGECAYSLGLEVFVDDYWESLLSLAKYGVRPLLFDQTWNKELPSDRSQLFSNLERIMGWAHLIRWVDAYRDGRPRGGPKICSSERPGD